MYISSFHKKLFEEKKEDYLLKSNYVKPVNNVIYLNNKPKVDFSNKPNMHLSNNPTKNLSNDLTKGLSDDLNDLNDLIHSNIKKDANIHIQSNHNNHNYPKGSKMDKSNQEPKNLESLSIIENFQKSLSKSRKKQQKIINKEKELQSNLDEKMILEFIKNNNRSGIVQFSQDIHKSYDEKILNKWETFKKFGFRSSQLTDNESLEYILYGKFKHANQGRMTLSDLWYKF